MAFASRFNPFARLLEDPEAVGPDEGLEDPSEVPELPELPVPVSPTPVEETPVPTQPLAVPQAPDVTGRKDYDAGARSLLSGFQHPAPPTSQDKYEGLPAYTADKSRLDDEHIQRAMEDARRRQEQQEADGPFLRASQGLYTAFTRGKLPESFFSNQPPGMSGGIKAIDLLRHELAQQKFGFDQTKFAAGQGLKEQDLARKMGQDEITNYLKARGLLRTEDQVADDMALKRWRADLDSQKAQHDAKISEVRTDLTRQGMAAVDAARAGAALQQYNASLKDMMGLHAGLKGYEDVLKQIKVDGGPDAPTDIDNMTRILNSPRAGGITSWLQEDKNKVRLAQTFDFLKQTIIRPLAGANLTDPEIQQFAKIFNDGALADPKYQALAVDMFRKWAGRRIQQTQAAFRDRVPPAAWESYQLMGGVTAQDPLYSDIAIKVDMSGIDQNKSPMLQRMEGNFQPEAIDAPPVQPKPVPGPSAPPTAPQAPAPVGMPEVQEPEMAPDGLPVPATGATKAPPGALKKQVATEMVRQGKKSAPGPSDTQKAVLLKNAPVVEGKNGKGYSKKLNVTFIYKNGQAVGVEQGDTRGR